eukprot:357633-Chlamydomonas_euryale.AAC.5
MHTDPIKNAQYSPSWRASSSDISSTRLARGVNGISTATKPEPRPMIFSTSTRASFRLTPIDLSTLAAMPAAGRAASCDAPCVKRAADGLATQLRPECRIAAS